MWIIIGTYLRYAAGKKREYSYPSIFAPVGRRKLKKPSSFWDNILLLLLRHFWHFIPKLFFHSYLYIVLQIQLLRKTRLLFFALLWDINSYFYIILNSIEIVWMNQRRRGTDSVLVPIAIVLGGTRFHLRIAFGWPRSADDVVCTTELLLYYKEPIIHGLSSPYKLPTKIFAWLNVTNFFSFYAVIIWTWNKFDRALL